MPSFLALRARAPIPGWAATSSKARSRSSATANGAAGRFARHHAEARRISAAARGVGLTEGRAGKGY